MKVLTTTTEINSALMRLIRHCSSCQVAVDWASVGFKAFEFLTQHAKKTDRMIVGSQFYQTHLQFIETFFAHPNVRFVTDTDILYHPKDYFFGHTWFFPASSSVSLPALFCTAPHHAIASILDGISERIKP